MKLQIFSDVSRRDGMGLELLDDTGEVVAEIFSDDATRLVTVSTFGKSVDLEDIERLILAARERLGSFEDGESWPLAPDDPVAPIGG